MESQSVYKIKDVRTGLYSTGGHYPTFSKIGKIWKTKGHIRTHIIMVYKRYHNFDFDKIGGFIEMFNNPYRTCIIEKIFLIRETSISIEDFMNKRKYKEELCN